MWRLSGYFSLSRILVTPRVYGGGVIFYRRRSLVYSAICVDMRHQNGLGLPFLFNKRTNAKGIFTSFSMWSEKFVFVGVVPTAHVVTCVSWPTATPIYTF